VIIPDCTTIQPTINRIFTPPLFAATCNVTGT
jgi:hypothetical protein